MRIFPSQIRNILRSIVLQKMSIYEASEGVERCLQTLGLTTQLIGQSSGQLLRLAPDETGQGYNHRGVLYLLCHGFGTYLLVRKAAESLGFFIEIL